MRRLDFHAQLALAIFGSVAVGRGLAFLLDSMDSPWLQLPRPLFAAITISPYLYFVRNAIKERWIYPPWHWLRLVIFGLCSLPLALLAAWTFLPSPNAECNGGLGHGRFAGRDAVTVGICVPWFHDYEEWVEIYPSRWSWIGNKSGHGRLAAFGPDDFGVQRDPKSLSIAFKSHPLKVEFDGSPSVTVCFADGTRSRVKPAILR